ncbi:hypothetical protein BC332_18787 [Capsicum chinense]|nr:hypothetical protein BC332_18787 [Capsicum chinense]
MTVGYYDPTISTLDLIILVHTKQTAMAVVDDDKRLIGEISSSTLAYCDKDIAAAIMNFSFNNIMAKIDRGGPPKDLIGFLKMRLQEKKLGLIMELMDEEFPASSSSSSASICSYDDESRLSRNVSGRSSVRWLKAIACYLGSSLVAMLIQALSHHANSIWVSMRIII